MRKVTVTVITLVILLILGIFAWRVAYYSDLIRSGQLTIEDLRFVDQQTVSDLFKDRPLPEGTFNLITDDDPFLGSKDAKVKIVEFADFDCPYSQKASLSARSLAQKYGDKIFYQYRDFPVDDLHPDARGAAEASECARDQGKFWEYHDKLYLNQNDMGEDSLIRFAKEINLNESKFSSCLKSGKYKKEVQEDFEAGFDAGVQGTPTFFINGNRIPGAIPEEVLEEIIKSSL